MGFRSTFTSLDYRIAWPQWFRDKYDTTIGFGNHGLEPLHSLREAKTYSIWKTLHEDIRRAIPWEKYPRLVFVLLYLHECGGITRCEIREDKIAWSEPLTWRITDGVEHWHCIGCSDVDTIPGAGNGRQTSPPA